MTNLLDNTASSAYTFTKPRDNFDVKPPTPYTIFYLSIIKPHTDSHELVGPMPSFKLLLPKIEAVVSNSPRGIDKLEELQVDEDIWGLRTPNKAFFTNGFDTFIVPGQRDVYTVLKVHREVNKEASKVLPSPVYTVIAIGPLSRQVNTLATLSKPGVPGKVLGRARNTRVVGSWADREEAKSQAKKVMQDMIEGKKGVVISEQWNRGGKGAGVLMAMASGEEWEVRVVYEDEVHRRAKEGYVCEGRELEWRF